MYDDVRELFNRVSKSEVEDCFLKINKYIEQVESTSNDAFKKLEEYNKDEEIAKLSREIKFLKENAVYIMSDTEKLSYRKFVEEHNKECNRSRIEVRISSTGIGHIINCTCLSCSKNVDITDISNW